MREMEITSSNRIDAKSVFHDIFNIDHEAMKASCYKIPFAWQSIHSLYTRHRNSLRTVDLTNEEREKNNI